ncbi:SCO family protein [Thalassotalea mangrovi]|uniref:SCO family protein n=1 Tax=Thalassotalea mangrovi TaxID=2572245 RepID=A0A4U1B588_9GAMM|nr:SCO family protein [Thalassotalea mangrovi]TKB45554.1 SCO family protein [Thalassotalea mangrovi]
MQKFILIILAIIAAAIGLVLYQTYQQSQQVEKALVYQQPRSILPFVLSDHNGVDFSNDRLAGKWSLVFFGYTSCPDVCPVTLQELNRVYADLNKAASDPVQVLLVSADPRRDTQQRLNSYINYFNKEFIALRADHNQLFPFSRNLGLMYSITDDSSQEDYLVNHSASIVLINPQGQIQAIFKPSIEVGQVPAIDAKVLLSDFEKIVRQVS